ncbi:MAG: 2Fe-2S iron-sulfur cluster-binding protein, partial [Gammaproteobacteria bacterium]
LILRAAVGAEDLRRSYSICAPVSHYERDGELRVAIRRVPGGRFSNWLNDSVQPGQTLEVMTPDGRFHVPLRPDRARHHVGFAGGSGITPMMSLIGTLLEAEPDSRFTLVYGNRATHTIMFVEQLEDLKNRYMGRLSLYHVLSDEPHEVELLNGLLDVAKCREFLDTLIPVASIDEAFVCGPDPMMNAAEAALRGAGLDPARIHIERFGVPLPAAGALLAAQAQAAGTANAPRAEVELVADGKTRRLRVPYDGQAILDAGLAAGMNLPFACKGGVCCTCRARVLEGEVRMDRNYTLEAHEIADGFVLTCQSHPVSARVVISYDER